MTRTRMTHLDAIHQLLRHGMVVPVTPGVHFDVVAHREATSSCGFVKARMMGATTWKEFRYVEEFEAWIAVTTACALETLEADGLTSFPLAWDAA